MTLSRSRLASITHATALLVVPLLVAPHPAQAETPAGPPKYVVRYDPRSLSSADGRKALRRRIALAARMVCANMESRPLLSEVVQYNKCVSDAMDRAWADVAARRTTVEAMAK